MCRPASFVLTSDRVYYSKITDSHEDIIEEYNLGQRDAYGLVDILRVELTPPRGDYSLPLDEWIYRVDQDELPEWYDAENAERRCRSALTRWAKHRIITNGEHVINGNTRIVIGGSVIVHGGCVAAYGSATVSEVHGGCVTACGSSIVSEVHGGNVRVRVVHRIRSPRWQRARVRLGGYR